MLPTKPKKKWLIKCDSSLTGGGAYSPEKFYAEEYDSEYLKHLKIITHLEALYLNR